MHSPYAAGCDAADIATLIARIAQLADTGDIDDYVACFTADAEWQMPGAPRRGRDDIRAGSAARRAAGDTGPGTNTRHLVGSIAVTVDGDHAEARSYFQFFVDTAEAPRLQLMGQYDDEFLRSADGWQLSRRLITFG